MSKKTIMLGNEAIARGAYEAGVKLSSAYPGTPSTEISEYLAKYDEIYTFSSSELFLSYAIYKDDLGIIQTGQVNLPNKFVKLISYYIKDSILYTVTYDDTHPMYRNYITLYNLKNNNILYCLALKEIDSDHLALLDAHFG